MIIIENEHLTVRIKTLGAELCGIYSKKHRLEYMWQPGHEIWEHSSLTLFPNNGRIFLDRAVIDGRVYPATMQGFAKSQQFIVTHQSRDSAVLELHENDITLRYFPYCFTLKLDFSLCADKLTVKMSVLTDGEKTVYFCLGMHPGFYLPLVLGERPEDYILRFNSQQDITRLVTEPKTMLLTGERRPYLTGEREIKLSDSYFNGGSHLLEGVNAKTVTLLSKKSGRFVELGIENFNYMCLWGNPIRSYLICIEPWCGTSDFIGTDHIWEKRPGVCCAAKESPFERTLSFRVG